MQDLHERWPHRWVTPKARSTSSPLHGLGIVAVGRIGKGEAVLGGVIVPASEIAEYWDRMGHMGIQISDGFFIVPTSREELEERGVINHSCDPNIGFAENNVFVAIRDIEADEELTFDYAFNETLMHPFTCKCGSAQCRKTITAEDWKLPRLQDRYRDYFSPYLRRKIRNL